MRYQIFINGIPRRSVFGGEFEPFSSFALAQDVALEWLEKRGVSFHSAVTGSVFVRISSSDTSLTDTLEIREVE
jgi:hypothetical protein